MDHQPILSCLLMLTAKRPWRPLGQFLLTVFIGFCVAILARLSISLLLRLCSLSYFDSSLHIDLLLLLCSLFQTARRSLIACRDGLSIVHLVVIDLSFKSIHLGQLLPLHGYQVCWIEPGQKSVSLSPTALSISSSHYGQRLDCMLGCTQPFLLPVVSS